MRMSSATIFLWLKMSQVLKKYHAALAMSGCQDLRLLELRVSCSNAGTWFGDYEVTLTCEPFTDA